MKQLIPALVLIAVVAGMALWYRSRVGEPTRTVPESVRPSATDDRPWSAIRVPPPGYSAVNRLKEKAPPGGDRFEVEIVDERIESALDVLRKVLETPKADRRDRDLDRVLAPSLVAVGLTSREDRVLIRDELLVASEARPGSDPVDRARFLEALVDSIAPLSVLDRVELKVFQIDPGADPIPSRVHFLFAGATDVGARHQFDGELRLSWRRADWKLLRWQTVSWFHSVVETAPFREVTRRALSNCESYRELLRPSIDSFRQGLDAASGIDVYGHHGISVGDADGDGLEDFYVAMPGGLPNLMYRARGDGTFEDVTRRCGADALDDTSQALFADLDNDGDQDLFLVTGEGAVVLTNDGGGSYGEKTDAFPRTALGTSTPLAVAMADYDLDGDVDVYIASYVFWRGSTGSVGSSLPIPYHEAHNGAPNVLLRNRGDATFEDVTAASGLDRGNRRFSFAVSWADYDDDGFPDLYVANDFGSNNLYRNTGDGTFVDVAAQAGVRDEGPGMSVVWNDYDNDGDLDLYVGNMFSAAGRRITGTGDYRREAPQLRDVLRRHARGNSLFRNRGDGQFDDVSVPGLAFFGRWSWSADFIDLNLDGHDDIYVQNGFVTQPKTRDL